jgi:geranylgeranyl diphosphate synthase, type II
LQEKTSTEALQITDQAEFKAKVEARLIDYCRHNHSLAHKIGDGYVYLWEEIQTYLLGGGKRFRPYLFYLSNTAFGGKQSQEAIIQVACAWELIHACLLIHDDIIDRENVRHGRPNIAGVYLNKYQGIQTSDAPHYALSTALLAGDLLLSAAYDIVNTSALSAEDKLIVQSYLHQAIFSVGGGELLDIESALLPINQSDPISIAHYKTASYSFQLPLICGAKLAGASETDLELLKQIGLELGIAFQLRDDLLGVFGDQQQTGKSSRSDIVEKKRTFLIKLALDKLPASKSRLLEELLAVDKTLDSKEIEEVIELIKQSGAPTTVVQQIADRSSQAKSLIGNLDIDANYKNAFVEFVTTLLLLPEEG